MDNIIINADSMEHLKTLDDNIFDSCVTDPPYHLASIVKRFKNGPQAKYGKDGSFQRLSTGFMGEEWDGGDIAFQKEFWEQVYRVLKPQSVVLAFAATRNYHRMAVAIEDAGFEIFDMINWMYGTGFPKGKNLLKPGHEPIVMARKGINKHLSIDECRIPYADENDRSGWHTTGSDGTKGYMGTDTFKMRKISAEELTERTKDGRYPANVIHDGSDEVLGEFKKFGESKGAKAPVKKEEGDYFFYKHKYNKRGDDGESFRGDVGTAARFFYCAKASKKEKAGTGHPTVKPLELMKYLVRLITPKDGIVLDPFAGTGTTGEAAILEGRKYYLIEKTEKYMEYIEKRINKYNKAFV